MNYFKHFLLIVLLSLITCVFFIGCVEYKEPTSEDVLNQKLMEHTEKQVRQSRHVF